MAKYTGNSLSVSYGGTTLTNVVSCDVSESGEVFDQTVAGDTDKSYLTGKKDGTVTINCLDMEAETDFDLFTPNTDAALLIHPQGNSSGKPLRTIASAIVTSRSRGVQHDGVVPFSVTLQISGGIADSTVV